MLEKTVPFLPLASCSGKQWMTSRFPSELKNSAWRLSTYCLRVTDVTFFDTRIELNAES